MGTYWPNTDTCQQSNDKTVFGRFKNPRNNRESKIDATGKNVAVLLVYGWGKG